MEVNDGAVDGRPAPRKLPVWDLPTRLFHWILAVLVCAAWASGKAGKLDLHMRIGEAILTLVIFRIAWGLVGSRHSRFHDFLVGPRAALAYVGELWLEGRGRTPGGRIGMRAGHTPLGGWMIVAMLLVLGMQAGSGLFASDSLFTTGPLNHLVNETWSDRLTAIHWIGSWIVPTLVVLHVAVILFYLLRLRVNLIGPMVTGRDERPAGPPVHERLASPWLALALVVAAGALVWGITSL